MSFKMYGQEGIDAKGAIGDILANRYCAVPQVDYAGPVPTDGLCGQGGNQQQKEREQRQEGRSTM